MRFAMQGLAAQRAAGAAVQFLGCWSVHCVHGGSCEILRKLRHGHQLPRSRGSL